MIRGDLTSDVVLADDDVFLKDEKKRAEYVMNEQGVIYKGSFNYISSMKWDYGQVRTRRGWMDWLHWDRGQMDRLESHQPLFPSCTV